VNNNYLPLLLLLFTFTACSASDQLLEEGEWEMTTQMEISGMPAGMPTMPATTYKQCLTNDMMVPVQHNQQNKGCEMLEQNVSGNTVTWSMHCESNGMVSEMNGSNTYTGDSMTGEMQMTSQGMNMVSHTTGKRLGPCK